MSNLSVRGEQNTTSEATALANLTALNTSPAGEYIRKTGPTTFENSTPAAGTGDVVKVGTPVNEQVAVWTGDGTLAGSTDFVRSSSKLKISTNFTGGVVLEDTSADLLGLGFPLKGHATLYINTATTDIQTGFLFGDLSPIGFSGDAMIIGSQDFSDNQDQGQAGIAIQNSFTDDDQLIELSTRNKADSSSYKVKIESTAGLSVESASGTIFNIDDSSVTLTGVDLDVGSNDVTMTGSLATTGDRVTKGWFTNLEITNMPTVGGTALKNYSDLTDFVDQTAWRVFYSNTDGDVTELALGSDGTFLKSNGASAAPSFAVPAGSGDVSKVGTPVDNQVGVWTGDGTLEGTSGLTYDGNNLVISGDLGSALSKVTKGWFTDLEITNMPTVGGTALKNYSDLTDFVDQTAWRVFYSNTDGDVTELALGSDGTFLKSNGASSAPSFATPSGSGDVSKVGTPANDQIGVWTGDGTIEGTIGLTYDGSNFQLTGDIGSTGTRITKGWFTNLEVTNMPTVNGTALKNYSDLTDFVDQTAWRVFYSNTDGDVTELALGSDGTFLKSNGASSAPSFATPSGSGDVSKVGTPVDNQVGVWTGDGTIEGTSGLTYDGSNLQLIGDIGSTGTRITKGWFTDLQVTNAIAGSVTGNAATATALEDARTIGGVSFDGTGNITVETATGGFTVSGGNLALGTNDITMSGSIGVTGTRVTKLWATDIESTNMPTVGGTVILSSLTAPQFTTIELGAATDTTLSRTAAGVVAIEGITVTTDGSTTEASSAATVVAIAGTRHTHTVTALAVADTIGVPTSVISLTDKNTLIIRIKDNGTARVLAWNAIFRAVGQVLPTTTVISKTLYVGFKYNVADTKWDLIAISQEA